MVHIGSKNNLKYHDSFSPILAYANLVAVKSATAIRHAVTMVMMVLMLSVPSLASEKPVLSFMQRIADSAIIANNNRSKIQFENIIQENVDIKKIGNYSLGSYINKISFDKMDAYYDGVINFMSRYAVMKSKYYQIVDVIFSKPIYKRENIIIINSKIELTSGSKYSIKWKLNYKNGRYKIRDASLFGFWLMPFQRRLFRSYVRQNNNDINALLVVLAQ